MTFFVAVPSAIKVFNWTVSLHKGSITFDAPMLYALGFVLLFTFGGVTGLIVATLAVDVHVQDTYFVVAHFHYIMVGGTVSAFFGGLHYWWPKITGRLYPEMWARFAAILTYVGFNLTFFPQFILGYLGMPRRYYAYPPEWQSWNLLSSAGASILAVAYIAAALLSRLVAVLRRARRRQPVARHRARMASRPSPPPKHNFERTPIVTTAPYRYDPEDGSFTTQDGTSYAVAARCAGNPVRRRSSSRARPRSSACGCFSSTETLFFGALIFTYFVYRTSYPHDFAEAGKGRGALVRQRQSRRSC